MQGNQWDKYKNLEPRLSFDRAGEILKNVYQAVGISPPENYLEILRQGTEKDILCKDGRES